MRWKGSCRQSASAFLRHYLFVAAVFRDHSLASEEGTLEEAIDPAETKRLRVEGLLTVNGEDIHFLTGDTEMVTRSCQNVNGIQV